MYVLCTLAMYFASKKQQRQQIARSEKPKQPWQAPSPYLFLSAPFSRSSEKVLIKEHKYANMWQHWNERDKWRTIQPHILIYIFLVSVSQIMYDEDSFKCDNLN